MIFTSENKVQWIARFYLYRTVISNVSKHGTANYSTGMIIRGLKTTVFQVEITLSYHCTGTVRYQKNNDKKLFLDDFVFLDGHGKETHKIIQ